MGVNEYTFWGTEVSCFNGAKPKAAAAAVQMGKTNGETRMPGPEASLACPSLHHLLPLFLFPFPSMALANTPSEGPCHDTWRWLGEEGFRL